MFTKLFHGLREEGVPVTLREYLDLLQGMEAGLANFDVEDFYYLARSLLVKDERNLDRFDRVVDVTALGGGPGEDAAS